MFTVVTANRTTNAFEAVGRDGESTTWFVQAGIERKWLPLGKTTVFGEYRHDNAGFSSTDIDLGDGAGGSDVQSSEFNFYAAGIVQNIDAAAMDLYIIYRHSEGELTNATTTGDHRRLRHADLWCSHPVLNYSTPLTPDAEGATPKGVALLCGISGRL